MATLYQRSKTEKTRDPLETEAIIKKLKGMVKKNSFLNVFLVAPEEETFNVKENEETIVLFLRHHWFTTLGWFLVTLFFLVLPALVKNILPSSLFAFGGRFVDGATLLWYIFTLTYFLRKFLDWYYDVYFITDERIVDINFRNMMSKQISDTMIERIQDISLSQQGFFESIFNYGDVLVQTAAEQSLFRFRDVPNPRYVLKVLQELIKQEEEEELNKGAV